MVTVVNVDDLASIEEGESSEQSTVGSGSADIGGSEHRDDLVTEEDLVDGILDDAGLDVDLRAEGIIQDDEDDWSVQLKHILDRQEESHKTG